MLRLLSIAIILVACGGDDDAGPAIDGGGATADSAQPASCSAFVPCGGDPTGNWSETATCLGGTTESEMFVKELCPTAQFMASAESTFTLELLPTGRFNMQIMIVDTYDYVLPPECVAGDSCEDVECTGDAATTGCTCQVVQDAEGMDADSPWTTMGTVLDLDNVLYDYCVDGDTLTLRWEEPAINNGAAVYTYVMERL